jgi:hypothetical protein
MNENFMSKKIAGLSIAFFIMFGIVYAGKFPTIGATYQLDRAQFPGKISVCSTEDAMTKYMEAKWAGDQSAMQKMLFKISTMEDIEKMKRSGGCTLISSYSQAKIIEKGVESHRAEFFAFPMEPMWGYYLYFGGRVQ